MEPSLRSSSYRPTECKLKRTDPALHETIQRFVESLSDDVRVSQYADVNFAIKKLQGKPWYWLTQIGRSGYLVFLPNTPAVWIDEQFKHSYKVQIRVSRSVYDAKTVLIASLDMVDGLLRLEDAWIIAGKNIKGDTHHTQTPFTQRWNSLLEFYCVLYKNDSALQQGLRIEPATYGTLVSIKDIQNIPNVMLAQGEDERRRLRVQLVPRDPPAQVQPKVHVQAQVQAQVQVNPRTYAPAPRPPPRPATRAPEPKETKAAQEAMAVAHPEYPDTYDLFIDGVKKGYAAVQDLDLSKRLKGCVSSVKEIRVKIEWNPEFSMYEINDILG